MSPIRFSNFLDAKLSSSQGDSNLLNSRRFTLPSTLGDPVLNVSQANLQRLQRHPPELSSLLSAPIAGSSPRLNGVPLIDLISPRSHLCNGVFYVHLSYWLRPVTLRPPSPSVLPPTFAPG
eukprot:Gb_22433 [translate_table: standard]